MRVWFLAALCALASMACMPGRAAVAERAGVVVIVDGDARITSHGGAAHAAKVGDAVVEGDVLATGARSELHVRMEDASYLVLREASRMQVESFRAEGGDDDRGVLRLFVGGVRSITGWIGKYRPKNYVLHTSSITIGIRGTDHETRYIPEGSAEGEPGTYDRVYAGATSIETSAGRVDIAPDQAGFLGAKARSRPQLLASIPRFYKPGPHETEINAKHAQIQSQIDERREERRRAIAAKRAELEDAHAKTKDVFEQNKAAAAQSAQSAREQREHFKAQREELTKDVEAAKSLQADIEQRRRALDDDLKSGEISGPELRERRRELHARQQQLAAAQEDIKRKRKALHEAADTQVDERYNAAQERAKALHDQQLEARDKRKAVEQERESAAQELKSLQQQENKRYREELKADRQGGAAAEPPAKP